MSRATLFRWIRLGPEHQPTGKTRHFLGSEILSAPTELRIVQYDGDTGFYLFYCDAGGTEFTDTYHESSEAAMSQAEWEFNVKPEQWKVPPYKLEM